MTIKVKPWGKDQGEFVLIEECDFDAEKHQLLESPDESPKRGRKPKADAPAESGEV